MLQLRLTQLLLAVMVIGVLIVHKKIGGWPVVTWPMYSRRTYALPPAVGSSMQLRVTGENQRPRQVKASDLLTMGRASLASRILQQALQEPDQARRQQLERYVTVLVLHHTRLEPPVRIEIQEYEWDVDPLAATPLIYEKPRRVVGRATLLVAADGTVSRAP